MRDDLRAILDRHNGRVAENSQVSEGTASIAATLADRCARALVRRYSPPDAGVCSRVLTDLRGLRSRSLNCTLGPMFDVLCARFERWSSVPLSTTDLHTYQRNVRSVIEALRHTDSYLSVALDAGGGHEGSQAIAQEFGYVPPDVGEGPVGELRQTIFTEILQLASSSQFGGVELQDDRIVVWIDDVWIHDPQGEYPDVPLGGFSITLMLDGQCMASLERLACSKPDALCMDLNMLRVWADDPVYHVDGDYFHPHVSGNGSVCLGDAEEAVSMAMFHGRICDMFQVLKSWLMTYGSENPFARIDGWLEGHRCPACGGWAMDGDDDVVTCATTGAQLHRGCAMEFRGQYYSRQQATICPNCGTRGPRSVLGMETGLRRVACVFCRDDLAAARSAGMNGVYRCWNCQTEHEGTENRVDFDAGIQLCTECCRPMDGEDEMWEVKIRDPVNPEAYDQSAWVPISRRLRPVPWRNVTRVPPEVRTIVQCECGASCLDTDRHQDYLGRHTCCPTCDPELIRFSKPIREDIAYLDAYLVFFHQVAISDFTRPYVETVGLAARGVSVADALAVARTLRTLEMRSLNRCRGRHEDQFLAEKVRLWNELAGLDWLRIKRSLPPEAVEMHDDMIATQYGRTAPHREARDAELPADERQDAEEVQVQEGQGPYQAEDPDEDLDEDFDQDIDEGRRDDGGAGDGAHY